MIRGSSEFAVDIIIIIVIILCLKREENKEVQARVSSTSELDIRAAGGYF